MKLTPLYLIFALASLLPFTRAHAAITCSSITSPGFNSAFTGTVPPTNIIQTSFTVTCQRNLAGDPLTLTYMVSANNGLTPAGQLNQAAFGANRLTYDVYKDSACVAKWKGGGGGRITDTMALSGFVATSKQTSYWGCIIATQVLAAGTYTDLVTMTLDVGGRTGTFPVNIVTPAVCTITTAPGNLAFTYTAFGGAVAVNTTFQPTCTMYLPYSMALDVTSSVISGLNYSLALNTTSSGGTSPLSGTGTGLAQTFYINGNMAAGQAGTCATGSCSPAANIHTLTITY